MDYQMIDSVMARKSLSTDPAFDDLVISIERIPSFNGCPLGLYYPDRATVVMPPDGLESALLHELGHRHGHYYYDDISEKYAEYFRKIYQPKGRALLYRGNHFERLSKFEVLFEEGERGAVEIALFQPLTCDELCEIEDRLYSYPESPPKIRYRNGEIPVVRFEFTKGVDWLTIVGATMAATVVATVGALGYAIYKVSDELPWVVPVSLLGTGLFFLLRAMAREAKVRIT
ncbi:hypothetical protein ES704_02052 [subsurface metagenome]|jgi:hypothetical protein